MGPSGCYHIRIISWNQNRFLLWISDIDSNTAANSHHLKYNIHSLHFKVSYWDIVHVKRNISIDLICSGGFIAFFKDHFHVDRIIMFYICVSLIPCTIFHSLFVLKVPFSIVKVSYFYFHDKCTRKLGARGSFYFQQNNNHW